MSKLVNQCWALCPGFRQVIPKFWINSECVSRNSGPQFMSWKSERQDYSPIAQTQKWSLGWDVAKTTPQDQGLSHRMVETRRQNKNQERIGPQGEADGSKIDSPAKARNMNRMTRLRTDAEGTAEISAPIFHASLSDLSRFQFLLDRHFIDYWL